jgi:uncharacterized protein
MTRENATLPTALEGKRSLATGDRFAFACHSQLPCFRQCCADVNIMLTPLDVLHLARRLGTSTREFLDTYTLTPIAKDLELPVVMLHMGPAPDKACPFVGPAGCTVYEERPWACRMYPVGMALPPARAGVEPEPLYFLFEDAFCHGREGASEWDVACWRADQGVPEREALEAGFRDIVGHPWFIGGQRRLDPRQIEMFYMACFDLDTFRCFIFESTFLKRFELEPELVSKIAYDDHELLAFAFRWLRYALFGEPVVPPRGGIQTMLGRTA